MSDTRPFILAAAQAPTLLQAALTYELLGFSVLACSGKKPAVNWSAFQQRRTHRDTIHKWAEYGLLTNVGIITGEVSGNLVVVDLDGHDAVLAFYMRFRDLMNTYAVTSGSGNGMHLYYYVHDLPPTTRVVGCPYGNIELRANGCYVVAPPSIHPSGKPYEVAFASPIQYVDNLRPVMEWIKSLIAQKHGGIMPPATNSSAVKSVSAWAQAALTGECANVRLATKGARNITLYRAALKMGSLIADGKLERWRVEDALLEAASALTQTDGEGATLRTIVSGIKQGMESSRERFNKRA